MPHLYTESTCADHRCGNCKHKKRETGLECVHCTFASVTDDGQCYWKHEWHFFYDQELRRYVMKPAPKRDLPTVIVCKPSELPIAKKILGIEDEDELFTDVDQTRTIETVG